MDEVLKQLLDFIAFLVAYLIIWKVDPFLLKLINRLFRALNWMTGKDNLYFARLGTRVMQPVALLYAVFALYEQTFLKKSNPFTLPWYTIFLMLLAWVYIVYLPKYIDRVARQKEKELLNATKDLALEKKLESDRNFYTMLPFLAFQEIFGFRAFCWKILIGAYLFVVYALSAEHPPYSRSQVKAWLSGIFSSTRETIAATSET